MKIIEGFKNDIGQGLIEYGLILALVSVVAVGALGGVGDRISRTFKVVADDSLLIDFDFSHPKFAEGNGNVVVNNGTSNVSGGLYGFNHNNSSGWIDGGLRFDGINDYVTIPWQDEFELYEFTIDMWITPYDDGTRHVIFTTWFGFTTEINADRTVKFGLIPGSYLGSSKITWGEKVNLTFTLKNNIQKIYINGDLVDVGAFDREHIYSKKPIDISWSTVRTKSDLHSIMLYNREKSSDEIYYDYEMSHNN